MALIEDIVNKQKDGARFVISAQALRLDPEEFETLVKMWMEDENRGFELAAVPHRTCIEGEFFIDRITVTRVIAPK
ncbi:hypothetical protein [Herminiimonas fonticola]|uniref:Uncharacterized protein n=1 Tax=Herminiimonas fonticola TaxID=303380 RepID=A0A4R6G8E4_9BURK|nr:hypothetical protein [Herminiimonas fonticola]RBA24289.1 hypothetical protein Hfont_2101 [Herminiimonas fonticola]TDN90290.1 hypothetical protein EV677_2366 [Herminiimonas fonticola]